MRKIQIFDTTLRDGEQSPGFNMTIEEKVEFSKQLEKLNVDVIEAGFAASSIRDKNAIIEISKNVSKPVITSLARLTKNDIEQAYEALKFAKKKRIHTFIATSDIHLKYKLRMTKDEVLNKVKTMVRYAKNLVDDIEFSLEDATRSDFDFIKEVIECAIASGATVINIPDTVGIMMPLEFMEFIQKIKKEVPSINKVALSCHCHNDLGVATANTVSAIKAGVDQVECTINGIGERAGNAALEEIVAILKTKTDYFSAYTSVNTEKIANTSRMLCGITNTFIQPNKAIVGENAFKHESGIHQHGILMNKETYEIIKAEDYGINVEHCVIGIHSGKHVIINKMQKMGYDIDNYDINNIVKEVKVYFESRNNINDIEFRDIVNNNFKTNYVKQKTKTMNQL